MKILIYKGGWFNGTRITHKEMENIIGKVKLDGYKKKLKEMNLKNKSLTGIKIIVDSKIYDLQLQEGRR